MGRGNLDHPSDLVRHRADEHRPARRGRRRSSTSAACRTRSSSSSAARSPSSPTRSATLAVRGAPAIGVAAAYGLALAALRGDDLAEAEAARSPRRARPRSTSSGRSSRCATTRRRHAHARCTRRRSSAAARWRRTRPSCSRRGTRALTHCNAGGLATGGYGTAVGALRAAWERDAARARLRRRDPPAAPGRAADRLGARAAGHPARGDRRLRGGVADGRAARSTCVVTGADRIAANGDTANKIGTYSLAVLAAHHGIPLYVVAPTLDARPRHRDGRGHPDRGARPGGDHARASPARNPAFDVTPAELITAIVTEDGVHRAPYRVARARMKALILAAGYATRLRPLTDRSRRGCCRSAAARSSTGSSTTSARPASTTSTSSRTRASQPPSSDWARGQRRHGPRRRHRRRTRTGSARSATSSSSRSTTTCSSSPATTSSTTRSPTRSLLAREGRRAPSPCYDVGDRELAKQYGIVDVDARRPDRPFVEKPDDPPSTLAATATYLYSRAHLALVDTYLDEGNPPDQPGQLRRVAPPPRARLRLPLRGRVVRHRRPEQLLEADNRLRGALRPAGARRRIPSTADGHHGSGHPLGARRPLLRHRRGAGPVGRLRRARGGDRVALPRAARRARRSRPARAPRRARRARAGLSRLQVYSYLRLSMAATDVDANDLATYTRERAPRSRMRSSSSASSGSPSTTTAPRSCSRPRAAARTRTSCASSGSRSRTSSASPRSRR